MVAVVLILDQCVGMYLFQCCMNVTLIWPMYEKNRGNRYIIIGQDMDASDSSYACS